jgi:hypothetical protein
MARDDTKDTIWTEFTQTVDRTARELEKWLETEQSRSVGQKRGSGESTGHASGRRIVAILQSKRADLDDDDFAHMRKVVGYAKRHLAQRPRGDVNDTAWRYSLMNWGHDPTRT